MQVDLLHVQLTTPCSVTELFYIVLTILLLLPEVLLPTAIGILV